MTALLGANLNIAQNVGFGIIALAMVIGAIRVVTANNVVHAALYLVCVIGGAAAQYLLVYAEFVAVTQVLVYVGGTLTLILFAVMLTSRIEDMKVSNPSVGIGPAFGLVTVVLFRTGRFWVHYSDGDD